MAIKELNGKAAKQKLLNTLQPIGSGANLKPFVLQVSMPQTWWLPNPHDTYYDPHTFTIF
jgi:hypothetical protein